MGNMQAHRPHLGRPLIFPEGSKTLSVLVCPEDYRALSELVERAKAARPGYNFGDLLRRYIRRGLAADVPRLQDQPVDPKQTPVRQLFALARRARRIAVELERKP